MILNAFHASTCRSNDNQIAMHLSPRRDTAQVGPPLSNAFFIPFSFVSGTISLER